LDEFDQEILKLVASGGSEGDEFDTFGKSIAQKLRKLSRRDYLDTQQKIQTVLYDAEMNQLNSEVILELRK